MVQQYCPRYIIAVYLNFDDSLFSFPSRCCFPANKAPPSTISRKSGKSPSVHCLYTCRRLCLSLVHRAQQCSGFSDTLTHGVRLLRTGTNSAAMRRNSTSDMSVVSTAVLQRLTTLVAICTPPRCTGCIGRVVLVGAYSWSLVARCQPNRLSTSTVLASDMCRSLPPACSTVREIRPHRRTGSDASGKADPPVINIYIGLFRRQSTAIPVRYGHEMY